MFIIKNAERADLPEILQLQYLAYQSEADLFGSRDIPPLKQTLDEVIEEFNSSIILKMADDTNAIIGSVRAIERDGTFISVSLWYTLIINIKAMEQCFCPR